MKYRNFTWSPGERPTARGHFPDSFGWIFQKSSENCSPTENLSVKKPGKVPVLHAVNDKKKEKFKVHPLHQANLWNLGFANSGRTFYLFPYFFFKFLKSDIESIFLMSLGTSCRLETRLKVSQLHYKLNLEAWWGFIYFW